MTLKIVEKSRWTPSKLGEVKGRAIVRHKGKYYLRTPDAYMKWYAISLTNMNEYLDDYDAVVDIVDCELVVLS